MSVRGGTARRFLALVVCCAAVALGLSPAAADEVSTKRCVGNPPRQTEDPMSPACVPFFIGDNGGETWPGVTEDEVRVVIYADRGSYYDQPVRPGLYDIGAPAQPRCVVLIEATAGACDNILVRVVRGLSSYFNDRWQTYARRVHYYLFVSGDEGDAGRRSDAATMIADVGPFAVVDEAIFGGGHDALARALADADVMMFSSPEPLRAATYAEVAPYAWGFRPDAVRRAELYADYVCSKVAPYPVRRAGNPPGSDPAVGQARRFGLYWSTDPTAPELRTFRDLVVERLHACGVTWAAEATSRSSRYVVDGRDQSADAVAAMARFREAGVTTVLWLGGVEARASHAAAALAYYPEIVLAGDGVIDTTATAGWQNQAAWQNAWAVHHDLRMSRVEEELGYAAMAEADPASTREERAFAAELYRDHFLLFLAIQQAGPFLTPGAVEDGLRALPSKRSTSPYAAACAFPEGDFTCVDDATEAWWALGMRPSGTRLGCFRLVRNGARFRAGEWEGGDDVFRNASDPCQGRAGTYRVRV